MYVEEDEREGALNSACLKRKKRPNLTVSVNCKWLDTVRNVVSYMVNSIGLP